MEVTQVYQELLQPEVADMAQTRVSSRPIAVGLVVVLLTTQRQMVELEHPDKDIGEETALLVLKVLVVEERVLKEQMMVMLVGLVHLPAFLALL
jgi:hypothetical protein